MSHTPHELADEFPDKADRIHDLKMKDGNFRKLTEDYHEVNRAIHRAETNVEPCSEEHEAQLRRQRLFLKDQIAAKLG
ncbi:YdcH family protein [Aestuariibius sp. 2305UL40-4]|uniref:YdcH family protein n=1 Tax=Aestuariibius violaceus TaxID=3234132 RepID=UPI00345EB056